MISLVGIAALSEILDDDNSSDPPPPPPPPTPDTTPPVITVNGDSSVTVEVGSSYTDEGATAVDNIDGSVSVSSSSNVNTSIIGEYAVTYTASDSSGNSASATRTVVVVDTTGPVITLLGENPQSVELGSTYSDAGATAEDASGEDIEIVTTGVDAVDVDTVATYTVTYTASDSSGNESSEVRTVLVDDTTAPVFTSSATFVVEEEQTEVGTVTATDITSVTFTISETEVLSITSAGVLSFISAPDYEDQENPAYNGVTMDFTAKVTATDANDNVSSQNITVQVQDVGGIDDNPATGTSSDTDTFIII